MHMSAAVNIIRFTIQILKIELYSASTPSKNQHQQQ